MRQAQFSLWLVNILALMQLTLYNFGITIQVWAHTRVKSGLNPLLQNMFEMLLILTQG